MPVTLKDSDDEAALKLVREAFESAKDFHESFRRKGDRFYARYRSYREVRRAHSEAVTEGRDVGSLLRDAAGPFGTDIVVPYAFTIIETTVPRMFSHNPEMLITPGSPADEDNVESVELMIGRQQKKIKYPLILQDVAKTGLVYGLGVQKVFQHEGPLSGRQMMPALERGTGKNAGIWVQGEKKRPGYCGPMAEAVDPYDFIWDPAGHDIASCRWVIHRTWRDNAYVKQMFEAGKWLAPEGTKLEDILELGSDEVQNEIRQDRIRAAGLNKPERRGDRLHEVWEFHDGSRVVTVIDRECPVQDVANPYWHGELPFQVYRPTRVPFEMVGIGEIEAIEDLLDELNVLRSQRRDNAAIVLQRPYFYFDGMVQPEDFVFGPGKAIPVDGDPRNIIFPAPLQDIPASGYQEDAALQRDIERTSGIDDTVMGAEGGGGASNTATGAQLVNAAANIRIQHKTRRAEDEVVAPACAQFLALNQQFILEEQVVPGPPKPGDMSHRAYSWYTVGPAQLAGEFEIEPRGGSMSPQSKIERQERAKTMSMMFANHPLVEQRKLVEHTLKEGFEVENPAGMGWLVPEEPMIDPRAIDMVAEELEPILQASGLDGATFRAAVMEAQAQIEMAEQGGEQPLEQPQGDVQQEPVG